MRTIQFKAEGYQLIVTDGTPTDTSYTISHVSLTNANGVNTITCTRYKYANVYAWGNKVAIELANEARYEIIDDAILAISNKIVATWCKTHTQWGHGDDIEIVAVYENSIYDTNLIKRQLFVNEQAIELNNGNFLIKDFGKYKSNLLIISEKPIVSFSKSTANIGGSELEEIRGKFFTTKKGNLAFDTTVVNPTHILYKDRWGGCFNDYRGNKLTTGLYNHRASSHGGGVGYDYAIYELNNIIRPSIEEF